MIVVVIKCGNKIRRDERMKVKRLLGLLGVAVLGTMFLAGPSLAGPSRAIIQEMGSTIAKGEVNVDLDVVPYKFNVITNDDTTLGAGDATLGGTTISSVNVSLVENLELRIGRLPGLRSYLTLPVVGAAALNPAGNNYGLTIKGAIPGVPGLAAWLGYGMIKDKDIVGGSSSGDVDGSSIRAGAAYTWAGPVILNATLGYGKDSAKSAGDALGDVTTIEAGFAALYPLRSTLLVGLELLYAQIRVGDDASVAGTQKFKITALAPALGARVVAGNWTIDAAVALLGASIKAKGDPALGPTLQDTASSSVVGVPTLRVNYKF